MLRFCARSCIKYFASSSSLRPGLSKAIRSSQLSTNATKGSDSVLHLFLLIIPASAFGLGTWQVYRLQWKKELVKQLGQRTTAAPLEVPENIEDLDTKALEYHRIKLRGTFDHSCEFPVMPRSLNEESSSSSGGLGKQPKSGAHIITPFILSDSGQKILINRGWVPRAKIVPDKRPEGQVDGEIEFVGFIRKNEKRAPFAPKNNPQRNHWFHRDVEAMAEIADSLPIQIDADAASTVPGGPIGGQTRVYLRNEHLQYLITWYSLSAATAYMYYRLRRKPKLPAA